MVLLLLLRCYINGADKLWQLIRNGGLVTGYVQSLEKYGVT